MTTFLLSLLPASLWIYGFNILFQKDHLLEKQGKWMREEWPKKFPGTWQKHVSKLNKALFDCAICMASVHGTIWFWVMLPYIFNVSLHWKFWPFYLIGLCGLDTIINKLTTKERIIVDE